MAIWTFAKENNFTIVTFDADFYDLATYFGHPPKIIWLRTGNTHTNHLAELINNRAELIKEFHANEAYKNIACIEIE
jgi:predicted nuclease of predicted toxin-antitoxin system